MRRQLLENPIARIAVASFLVVVLLSATAYLLLNAPGEQGRVRATVEKAIAAFEQRDIEGFLACFADPMVVDAGGYGRFTAKPDLAREALRGFQSLGYLNIRIQGVTVDLPPEGTRARMELEFHWTASRSMYPNARSRSESRNEDGRPERADLLLDLLDGEWLISEVRWTPSGVRP